MTMITQALKIKGADHNLEPACLNLQDVTVTYNGDAAGPALESISACIEQGEHIAVVGPNGAGKSTLFKLIVGTLQPTSGIITMHGSQPEKHICIGYVPQRSQVDWQFPVTVQEVVMMGRISRIGLLRWPRRQDKTIVQTSLERVNALHLADRQIGELSGGQQQRVFIARALAQEADVLLLDEPLTGLDLPSQEAIFGILDSLRPDGVTVLLSTHDLALAAERFDKILLLNRHIIAFERPEICLTTENLLAAYGGHMHTITRGDETHILTDSCCEEH